jgi:DNA-binding MarR family transcriptional regulator
MDSVEPIRVGTGFRREFPHANASSAELGANLVRASNAFLRELNRRRRPIADLSASGFEALAIIDGAGEALPGHVIAERLLVTTASMTSLVDTLERKGFVTRQPHPEDRRKILVELTATGAEIVDRMLPVVYAAATDVFGFLTEDAREDLIHAMTKVCSQVESLASQPSRAPRARNRRPTRR